MDRDTTVFESLHCLLAGLYLYITIWAAWKAASNHGQGKKKIENWGFCTTQQVELHSMLQDDGIIS